MCDHPTHIPQLSHLHPMSITLTSHLNPTFIPYAEIIHDISRNDFSIMTNDGCVVNTTGYFNSYEEAEYWIRKHHPNMSITPKWIGV